MSLKPIAIQRSRPTQESVTRPHQLARHVDELGTALESVAQFINLNPLSSGNLVSAVFTGGVAKAVAHGLGRAPRGYFVVLPPIGVTNVSVGRQVLPVGYSADKFIMLEAVSSGEYGIWVF